MMRAPAAGMPAMLMVRRPVPGGMEGRTLADLFLFFSYGKAEKVLNAWAADTREQEQRQLV